MKKFLYALIVACTTQSALAQISITASDMPIAGDTLRYSTASPTGSGFSAADSGTAKVWDFSMLSPLTQGIDTYKTASAVNITYALTISPTAYGYKVADSFPGLSGVLPISITNLYTFFNKKTGPARYIAEGFAAVISGLPTPVNYSDEDEWYYFPLTYARSDSSTFSLKFSLPTLGSIKQAGYRKTRVDGWGTIVTPYFTTPTNCIRVRSEIHEIDSIDLLVTKIGLPRNTVEYKFLANGQHYPALWVTASLTGSTETITSIRYRDVARSTMGIASNALSYRTIKAYPNPAQNGIVYVELPADWQQYQIACFDLQGKLVATTSNKNQIDLSQMPAGRYVLQVLCGNQTAYALIER